MRRKISNEEIEDKILDIFGNAGYAPLSIREVTIILKEKYDIRLSSPIVKRHLFKLKKDKKIN